MWFPILDPNLLEEIMNLGFIDGIDEEVDLIEIEERGDYQTN